ncbi:Protein MM3350-like domain [Lasallia pustulata]|uniref:Protein MM3350-like domain n=1 Tax=Lasallia pustulata TaxID=136370 RepID=A0A1W5D4G5_9LECA|nr:Protein MM3350-like domain [Lasallia pustulata]
MSTPQGMMQYNVEYKRAGTEKELKVAQTAYSKSTPNEQPCKRKRSDDTDSQASRDLFLKSEPYLKGLYSIFEGEFYGEGQLWNNRGRDPTPLVELVRRYGGEVTRALSGRTSYAVVGSGVESSKRQIIEESQVKTVTESGFIKLVKPLIAVAKVPAQPLTKLAGGNELNYLVRVAFDWQRCGQWAFMALDPRIKHSYPITSTEDAYMCRKMEREDSDMKIWPSPTVQDYIDQHIAQGNKIIYVYDNNCRWDHQIEVLGRAHGATDRVVCIGGEGHPAGEDIGGADEWVKLQEALLEPADPGSERYDEQKELITWYNRRCENAHAKGVEGLKGDGFCRWDMRAVNEELENLDDMEESDFTEEDFYSQEEVSTGSEEDEGTEAEETEETEYSETEE